MSRRLPATPPNLPGFAFVRVLGSGGFADVHLYEQNMPRRLVAVKVLLAEVASDDVRRMFQAEVNHMARLASHPSILTVYQAGVAADGRPYLVMEYCHAALAQRYRITPLPLAEALETGVRIASAAETAHREGVLHRDIKPSNILTTAFGHPVLSDFGIAATLAEAERTASVGLSIPWSAPEVLREDAPAGVASEVWSLGATVYSLLAGRSPFEVEGGDNGSAALVARISRAKPPPIGRPDVPASLEQALQRAMSRRPEDRPASALEFARDLQAVEEELSLRQTPIDAVVDEWADGFGADLDDRTRVVGAPTEAVHVPRRRRRAAAHSVAVASTPEVRPSERSASARTRSAAALRRVWAVSAAAVALVAVVATAVVVAIAPWNGIPTVGELRAEIDGDTVAFTWDDPGIASGDTYLVTVDDAVAPAQRATVYLVDASGLDRVCASVRVARAGKTGATSREHCVDLDEPVG
ncbi:serine/threonine-protein kinase [Agromyces protaetiae]|uniref:serine/threonine-protein kinase n=1 Tax=Agromyces protaetiae TaxID=2509455 RepID=UPI001FB6F2FA|nr:serine/threonine-protein kinase [Agromyces protaetiae]